MFKINAGNMAVGQCSNVCVSYLPGISSDFT